MLGHIAISQSATGLILTDLVEKKIKKMWWPQLYQEAHHPVLDYHVKVATWYFENVFDITQGMFCTCLKCIMDNVKGTAHHHHILINLCFPCLHVQEDFLCFQAFLSLVGFLLTMLSFRSLLLASFHVSLRCCLGG